MTVSTDPRPGRKAAPLAPATTPTGTEPEPKRPSQDARTSSSGARTSSASRSSSSGKKRTRRRVLRWVRRIAVAVSIVASISAIALAVYVRKIEAGLPSTAELRRGYRPPQVTRILAGDGSTLAELFTERRTVVKIGDLPPHVKLAVLAAEDANFYEHAGLNYFGIARAVWVNLRHKKTRQGASTITQQVVKNLLLDPERTYGRKIREILLARRIEQELTKDEILELYLNHIYFGAGRYGIEEAARGYFGKHASQLTIAEAALIAGLAPAPNAYNPRVDLEAALRRRTFVLGQMRDKAFITPAAYDAAIVEPVKLAPVAEANDELAPEVVDLVRKTIREVAGEEAARRGGFTVETTIDPKLQLAARNAVREATSAYDKRWKLVGPFAPYPENGRDPKTKKKLPPQEKPFDGTPKYGHGDVYVGVVVGHDDAARTVDVQVGSVRGFVKLEDKDRYDPTSAPPSAWAPIGTRLRVSLLAPPPSAGSATASPSSSASSSPSASASASPHDTRVPLRLELGPESALVSIDVRTRRVLALVGSVEAVFGLDRATHAKRQPGSTFKPFVYGAALRARKVTPASLIEATAGDFGGWNPKNYEAFAKDEPVRLREALAQSINLVAVRVAKDVGPPAVIDFARAAGITSKLEPDLAIALGSYEVTPIELANAYATIAAGGVFEPQQIIVRIVGPDGKELPLPARKPPTRTFGDAEAYVLTNMMTSVVDHGTAASAKVLGRPIAGKTGTSNAAKDTWFAGFTPDIVTVAWVGYDDSRPLGWGEAGARTALPAWVSFMKVATKDKPRADFPRPPGVVTVKIDAKSGKLPYAGEEDKDTLDEVFLAGTEPKDVAEPSPDSTVPPKDGPEDPWAVPPESPTIPAVASATSSGTPPALPPSPSASASTKPAASITP